jgi:hypothetical protein
MWLDSQKAEFTAAAPISGAGQPTPAFILPSIYHLQ